MVRLSTPTLALRGALSLALGFLAVPAAEAAPADCAETYGTGYGGTGFFGQDACVKRNACGPKSIAVNDGCLYHL